MGLRQLMRAVPFALATALLLCGCSREERARFDIFGDRERLVSECCACLAFSEADADVTPLCTVGSDSRECLCGLTADQCVDELIGDETGSGGIRVVGGCLQTGGVCARSCDGVLVFPE